MKQLRLTARYLASGFAVGILLFFSIYRNPVQAIQGTATFTGTSQELTGDITAGRLVDQANTDYYIDPAASGNSLVTAGTASVSGNLVLNASSTIGTTNMQPLTIGSATTGLTTVTSGGKLQLQAGGTGTGSTGTGSIYFLNSSGTTAGRFATTGDFLPGGATGGTITTSGGYTIHTFTTSGTFTPGVAGNVEYLVVGGGGGGGGGVGSGGGAGAYWTNFGLDNGLPFAIGNFNVVVGAGGAGVANANGNPGTDSSLDYTGGTITAIGGGYGTVGGGG